MAELILTDEERKSATFIEWSDEALGRACKKIALIIADDSGREAQPVIAAAAFLVSRSIAANATKSIVSVFELTLPDPVGDWRITVERITDGGK